MTSRLFLNWSEPLLLATKSSCLPLPANRKHLVQNLGFLMTDYYPMIARCVADLEENAAVRHEFYWLARAELAVQLCGLSPPLTQSEMMRERLALDEAIRKVEDECLSQVAPITERSQMSTPGGPSTRVSSEMRLVTQGRQRQASGGATLESASTSLRALIAF